MPVTMHRFDKINIDSDRFFFFSKTEDFLRIVKVNLIALLNFHRFQILLTPRKFPVWNFVVWISARKAMLYMGWVLSIFSCQYLY